jgi:hypothetical protein
MPRFVEVFDIKLNCDLLVNLDAIKYISKRSKEHGGETLVHIGSESTYFILGPAAFGLLRDLLSVDGSTKPDPVGELVDGICSGPSGQA